MICHWFRAPLAGWAELVWTWMFCCPWTGTTLQYRDWKQGLCNGGDAGVTTGRYSPGWCSGMDGVTTTVPPPCSITGGECVLCCSRLFSLCRCLLAPHTTSYRQKPRVFMLSAELSEGSTHSNVLLPVAEDLLLTMLVLFGSHIRFYCLEVQSCMDT